MSQLNSSEEYQYLTFRMAAEDYAIRILKVKEIIAYDFVTRVPGTPPWIRGVINLRGAVVPVVDLSVKFSLNASVVTKSTCIVIVEVKLGGEDTIMGVIADAVDEVVFLSQEDVEPPPPFGSTVSVNYLVGLGKIAGKFVLILDIDRVLSSDELLEAASANQLLARASVAEA
ncbi:MAG: chemotaxis protein CheW [Terriglobales bacterium]